MNEAGPPAGFWIRAVALVVDLLVFSVVQFSLGLFAGVVWGPSIEDSPGFQSTIVLFTLFFAAAYTSVLHTMTGQMIGKLVVGVRVVGTDGALLPLGAAFLRWLGYWLSLATLGFGYAIAGLRRDRRALHDLLAGSRVEWIAPAARRAPAPPQPPPAPAPAAPAPPAPSAVPPAAPPPPPAPGGGAGTQPSPFARPPA
jgi:uncharacterized RDD family membrane protein YckC